MRINAYKKLFKSDLFRKVCKFEKGFEHIEQIKLFKFEGDWDDL